MHKFIIIFWLLLLSASCTTIDVERRVIQSGIGTQENIGSENLVFIEQEPEIIIKDRPVYVPEKDAVRTVPATGTQAVREAQVVGIQKPSEYSHAAMVYDYDRDWVYEVYAQPLRAGDIRLEAGERVIESPFVSDSERWMLGAGISYEAGVPVQHIYIKPTEVSLEASLIINTDRRVYHIILRSFKDIHMPMIRWRYPATGMPENFIQPFSADGTDTPEDGDGVDPRFLSFNYRITYGLFKKPRWLPELVYDDGKKTYITFPESTLQRELPAVYENRRDVVNYRVQGKLIIIDKLIEELTIKIEQKQITITKKHG